MRGSGSRPGHGAQSSQPRPIAAQPLSVTLLMLNILQIPMRRLAWRQVERAVELQAVAPLVLDDLLRGGRGGAAARPIGRRCLSLWVEEGRQQGQVGGAACGHAASFLAALGGGCAPGKKRQVRSMRQGTFCRSRSEG